MSCNIEKIYGMLSWDNDPETQARGIADAKKIHSLRVFILPILKKDSKGVWENCAKVLESKSNQDLAPYQTELFRWLQDMNWPGASLIYDRLLQIPYEEIVTSLEICLKSAKETNDWPWERALLAFKNEKCNRDTSIPSPKHNKVKHACNEQV